MSHRPQLPPISHLQAIADHRAAPKPFELPSPQPNTQEPRIGPASSVYPNPEAYRIPISQAPIRPNQPAARHPSGQFPQQYSITPALSGAGANPRAPHPHHLVAVAGHLFLGIPSHPGPSAMAHPSGASTIPGSYIAELARGNVGDNYIWNELYLAQLAELEPLVLQGTGEKGWVFWKVWVDLRKPGLDLRDAAKKNRFIASALKTLPWFKEEESFVEAIKAMERFDGMQKKLATAKYAQHVHYVMNRPSSGVTVIGFLEAERRNRAQAAAQAQR